MWDWRRRFGRIPKRDDNSELVEILAICSVNRVDWIRHFPLWCQPTWNWKESLSVPWPKCRYQTAPSSTSCWVKDVVVVKPRSSTSEGRHPSGGPSAGAATSTTSPAGGVGAGPRHVRISTPCCLLSPCVAAGLGGIANTIGSTCCQDSPATGPPDCLLLTSTCVCTWSTVMDKLRLWALKDTDFVVM